MKETCGTGGLQPDASFSGYPIHDVLFKIDGTEVQAVLYEAVLEDADIFGLFPAFGALFEVLYDALFGMPVQ